MDSAALATAAFLPDPQQQAELLALLTLQFTPTLGPRRIEALRAYFGSAQAALEASRDELRGVDGLTKRGVEALGSAEPRRLAEAEWRKVAAARAEGKDIYLLGRGLEGYPSALEALGDPPPVLWVRGPLPPIALAPQAIGIVGTRAASNYALGITRQLAADLARLGVVVVSGLARGIDTAAHAAAVDAGGLSIGVLGNAVDRVYPPENVDLARRLTLLSEYPLGTGSRAHHFPQRNRLIAALSAGVVVVEGALKSGSLITATHALECGRTVFAVPGQAGQARSAGPHRLLREGAVLTESVADILQELGWEVVAAPAEVTAPTASTTAKAKAEVKTTPSAPALNLPPDQAAIYAALGVGPRTLDDLAAVSGLGFSETQTALIMLQLSGQVEENGGRWQLVGG